MEKFSIKNPESQEASSPEGREWLDRKWVTVRFEEGKTHWEIRAREGFSVVEEAKRAGGSTIEVAGPTESGFFFHDIKDKPGHPKAYDLFEERKKVFVSNLYPGAPHFEQGQFSRFLGPVDFIADARILPVKDDSVGVLFCSCLGPISAGGRQMLRRLGFEKTVPQSEVETAGKNIIEESLRLREKVIQEARRVLKNGGLLVWQGGKANDLKFALNNGFILLQIEEEKGTDIDKPFLKMVFQKSIYYNRIKK